MNERPDPSVFDEPAHRPEGVSHFGTDSLSDEPALGDVGGVGDPRDAPNQEPALAWADGLPTYGEVYEELRADTTKVEFRSAVIVASCLALVSGIALIPVLAAGSILWGPWVVVALLSAPTLALVERRPWQISSASVPTLVPLVTTIPTWVLAVFVGQVSDVGRVAGFMFAIFLTAGATLLGVGMTNLWRRAHHEHEPPSIRPVLPYAAAALAVVLVGMVVTISIVV